MVVLCWWERWTLAWSDCLENVYPGQHSCTKCFQLSRESKVKKTEEAQIRTNGSQKHRTSVLVRIWKKTKQMQRDHCPLADGTHKICNCPLFKNMSVNDRYAAVRKQRLCCGCLGKGHAIKATIRKSNGRGQSRSQRKCSNNQPK